MQLNSGVAKPRVKKIIGTILIVTFSVTGISESILGIDFKKAFASPPASSNAGSIENMKESAGTAQSFQTDLFTGRATTSIPIFAPPGRHGLTPQVSLGYSSSGGNSWLGTGWNMDHGVIQRSTKKGVPTYNNDQDTFTFVLNGVNSDLIRIGSSNEYHAKDESGEFLKFTFENNFWIVKDKSGITYTFGETEQARNTNARGIFCWCIEKMKDPYGNTIRYTYQMDQEEMYIDHIDYNGNEDLNFQPTHSVHFITEPRPDVTFSYMTGVQVTTAKRLKKILVKVQGQIARKYTLQYEQSPVVGRSRLASVQECGTDSTEEIDGACLPAQTFAYTNHQMQVDTNYETFTVENGNGSDSSWNATHFTYTGYMTDYVSTLDMNGDGLPDRVMVDQSGFNKYRIQMNSPANWFGPIQNWNFYTESGNPGEGGIRYTNPSWGTTELDTFDINGDGLPDKVNVIQDGNPTNLRVQINTGAGFASPVIWQIENGNPGYWFWGRLRATDSGGQTYQDLIDMNGDGMIDRIMNNWDSPYSFKIQINNGTGFNPSQIWPQNNPPQILSWGHVRYTDPGNQVKIDFADLNGDGLPDRVFADVNPNGYNEWKVLFSDGTQFLSPVTWPIENGNNGAREWGVIRSGDPSTYQDLIDMNGDGLLDRVMRKVSAPFTTLRVQFNTGSGFRPSVEWNINNPDPSLGEIGGSIHYGTTRMFAETMDLDGDGLPDRVQVIDSGSQNQWKVAKQLGPIPDLLQTINNGRGGITTIEYKPSTQFDNRDENLIYRLPFPVEVVTKVTQQDGMGNSYETRYSYKGGMYDAPTREFRGFRETTVTDVRGTKSITTFLQDEHRKGRIQKTETRDQNGNLFTKVENTWGDCGDDPFPGVHFVKLRETNSFLYDGDSTYKQTRKRFDYDLTNGNLTTVFDDGDPDIAADDRRQTTEYTTNPDLNILNTVSKISAFDSQNTLVSEKYLYYDNHENLNVPPLKGTLTKQEDFLTAQDPRPTTRMFYDDFGNLTRIRDARGFETINTYESDLHLYLTRITNTLDHTQEFTYDPLIAQITQTRDQNGQISRTIYDPLGRAIKQIAPYDSENSPTQAIVYDDRYNYSEGIINRVITHAKERQDAPTLILNDQRQDGYLTTYAFMEGLGREIEKRSPAENPDQQIVSGTLTFDNRGQIETQYVSYFDEFRRIYHATPVSIPHATFTYDAVGRKTRVDLPESTQEHPVFSTVEYNDYIKTITDPNGHLKIYTQDSFGNLIQVEERNQGETYTTHYQYDSLNRLTRTIDHLNHATEVHYDLLGRKREMFDPNMGHWLYDYDQNNNLISQTDAKNQTIQFQYDQLNRLTRKTYPDQTEINYVYDNCPMSTCGGLPGENYPIGKLLKVVDESGVQTFRYDRRGRVFQDRKELDNGRVYSFTRIYDSLGRVTSLQYPDEDILHLTFNAAGEAKTITLIPQNTEPISIIQNVHYNSSGQITQIQYGNNVTTDYSYNPLTLRLEDIQTLNQQGNTLQQYHYVFDNVGNVKDIIDSIHTDPTHTNTQHFEYDDLDRLILANGSYGSHQFQYDPIGNMTHKAGATLEYTDSLHPQAVTRYTDSTGTTKYKYDLNGNLIQRGKSRFDQENLTYDYDNRLVRIEKSLQTTCAENDPHCVPHSSNGSQYTYDASGQRVKKVARNTNGASRDTTTYYLGKDYEIEYNHHSSLTNRTRIERKAFFLGAARVAELEQTAPSLIHCDRDSNCGDVRHLRFFHQDHLGSTDVITNEQGLQTLLMRYLPYGEKKLVEGSDPVDNTFTGQKDDTESSLMYYNARYYDPKLGRFITADSIVGEPANPQSLNRYSYCDNNPVRFTDPTGHRKSKFWKKLFQFAKPFARTIALAVQAAVIFYTADADLGKASYKFTKTFISVGATDGDITQAFISGGRDGLGSLQKSNNWVYQIAATAMLAAIQEFDSWGHARAPTLPNGAPVGSVYLFHSDGGFRRNSVVFGSAVKDFGLNGPASVPNFTDYSHTITKIVDDQFLNFANQSSNGRIINSKEFSIYYEGWSDYDIFEPIIPVDEKKLMQSALNLVGKPWGGIFSMREEFTCSRASGYCLTKASGKNFLSFGRWTTPTDLAHSPYLKKRD